MRKLSQPALVIHGRIAERVREEAKRLEVSVDEYLVELLSQRLDARDRAREYVEVAQELLLEAREELGKGNVRQAAEKVWGAVALTVKAYVWWRDGRRITSHGELWEYKRMLEDELGDWVSDAWNAGNTMRICFYEGWCARKDVEGACKRVEKLVKEVASRIIKE